MCKSSSLTMKTLDIMCMQENVEMQIFLHLSQPFTSQQCSEMIFQTSAQGERISLK
jgi:hypothetical protein